MFSTRDRSALGEPFWAEDRGSLRKRRPKPYNDSAFATEFILKINGRMVYLWRAVDAEGEVPDVMVQSKEQAGAAETHAQAFEELLLCPR